MDYREELEAFCPQGEEEAASLALIRQMAERFGGEVLSRECLAAHITGSGMILNEAGDRTLMVCHNIYRSWSWTGGHADGEHDLLQVALREAREETGITRIEPLVPDLVSVDVLAVPGHRRRGRYVSPHLHLSLSYLLVAPEGQKLASKPDENSGVRWIAVDEVERWSTEPEMVLLYRKLLERGKRLL